MSKLWGGRFTKQTDQLVEEYTASITFDKELAEEDIRRQLGACDDAWQMRHFAADDVEKIKDGLLAGARHDSPRRAGVLDCRMKIFI